MHGSHSLPPASVGFLLALFFSFKDGGDVTFKTLDLLLTTWCCNTEDCVLHSHHCENLKSIETNIFYSSVAQ
jgi:hypothetical protein